MTLNPTFKFRYPIPQGWQVRRMQMKMEDSEHTYLGEWGSSTSRNIVKVWGLPKTDCISTAVLTAMLKINVDMGKTPIKFFSHHQTWHSNLQGGGRDENYFHAKHGLQLVVQLVQLVQQLWKFPYIFFSFLLWSVRCNCAWGTIIKEPIVWV